MSLSSTALWSLVLLPAVVGSVLVLSRRAERVAPALSVATGAVVVLLAVVVAGLRPRAGMPFVAGSDLALGVDGLSAAATVMVAVVTLLVLVFAAADIEDSRARFHGLMLVFAAAALLTATATTLPTLLVAWEVMGATSYALIGFWWREQERVGHGATAFLTTRAADLGLYLAAGAALAGGSGLGLAALADSSPGWRHVIAAGVLLGALGKAAQLPFSFWLSQAMSGPSPVSALLHSAAMVAMGGYLLLRVAPLLDATGWAGPVTAWLGVATAVLLGVVALAQRDLKQLLAASTAAQLGFVVLAAGVSAVAGGAAHLVAHAATKALLFLAAGAWLSALGTQELPGLHGVARRWPVLGWSATVGALALAGVAPLSLWATKDVVLAAALEVSPWLYAAGLTASALSAGYAGKVLVTVWRSEPAQQAGPAGRRGTPSVAAAQQAPVALLAVGAAVLGLLALGPFAGGWSRLVGDGEDSRVPPVELVVSAVLALVVLGLVLRRRGRLPEPRWAREWLGLDRAVAVLVVAPTFRLAEALARFDDQVLDRGVERTATATVRLGAHSARVDDRGVDGLVESVARRARALGDLAARPQSGQLHQYYLQAVVVLTVGAVLIVLAG